MEQDTPTQIVDGIAGSIPTFTSSLFPPSVNSNVAVSTPSPPLKKKKTSTKTKKKKVSKQIKSIGLKQTTLTQIYTEDDLSTTVPIMDGAAASFNDRRYVDLTSGDDIDLNKISDVVQHNVVIQNELRDLDQLCALRELPFFLMKK